MSKLTQARERIAALETRDVHVLDGDGEEPWVQYKAIKLDEVLAIIDGLIADERAMLEPTPDARELALSLAEGVWERNTLYVGARNQWLSKAAQLIAAHDARLLDEAAERGVQWLIEQTSHIDPALAETNSGKWLIKLREKQTVELRAAITDEEE